MVAKKSLYIFYLGFIVFATTLYSDTYHNIQGFYGERAAGLGGAFTAVSDDPSGAFYNPAGLAFAYDNSISLSASNYKNTTKSYSNVLGAGQSYEKKSNNYTPNFFGIVRSVSPKLKMGFSIVNPINDTFNRNDQINLPLYYPDITNMKNYNIESYSQIQAGFSAAYSFTDRLSLGASLYATSDTASITQTSLVQAKDKSYSAQTFVDNRRTLGMYPVVGFMFAPSDLISIGVSLRKQFVTAGNRLVNAISTASGNTTSDIVFTEATHRRGAVSLGNTVGIVPSQTGYIPETTELRGGIALFPTKRLMIAGDLIYTSGYKRLSNQNYLTRFTDNTIQYTLNDKEIQELTRYSTLNFAGGVEYFASDNIVFRLGGFTNNANSKENSWLRSALEAQNRIIGSYENVLTSGNVNVRYLIPAFRSNVRNEYVNTIGYTFGFSWSTAKASLGITFIKEYGKGSSQLDDTRPSQQLIYNSTAFYVVVSSRTN